MTGMGWISTTTPGVRASGTSGLRGRRRRPTGPARRGRSRHAGSARRPDARRTRAPGTSTPRDDADGLEAAAALCRSAGYWAVPYPVAERLATPDRPRRRRAGGRGRHPAVGAQWPRHHIPLGRGDTRRSRSHVTGLVADGPAFVAELRPVGARRGRRRRHSLGAVAAVLDVARHAGSCDRAHGCPRHRSRAVRSATSVFQGVQFQLTDAEVERSGVESSPSTRCGASGRRPDAVDDALALRRRPSRRPTWSSGSPTSSTARSGSATRRPCRGSRGTASRCGGSRWAFPRRGILLTRRVGGAGLKGLLRMRVVVIGTGFGKCARTRVSGARFRRRGGEPPRRCGSESRAGVRRRPGVRAFAAVHASRSRDGGDRQRASGVVRQAIRAKCRRGDCHAGSRQRGRHSELSELRVPLQ